jgi:hypothetical protein
MRKLVLVTALLVSASISAIADEFLVTTPNGIAKSSDPVATAIETQSFAELPQTPTPMSWVLIASAVGPRVPVGWQLSGIEGVIYNGNSINRWQLYFYNPVTRQTAGWLIQVH